MKTPSLTCPACAHAFHHRVKRSWLLKHAFYFLPIKVYHCNHCEKNVYVLMTDQSAELNKSAW
jgi:DNA-directed RNA polymerase subunit RPC12/RpoP